MADKKDEIPKKYSPSQAGSSSQGQTMVNEPQHTKYGKQDSLIPEKMQFHPESLTAGSRKKGPTTRIIVKYDVGFNNAVYLRGDGADLSWDRGIILKNIKSDEWVWETNIPFNKCEFKVLINDRQYELGENHLLLCGTSFEYTPSFHQL